MAGFKTTQKVRGTVLVKIRKELDFQIDSWEKAVVTTDLFDCRFWIPV